jgi:hypothetical protein
MSEQVDSLYERQASQAMEIRYIAEELSRDILKRSVSSGAR